MLKTVLVRFEATVTAQFHGHTHDDWFIVYHTDPGRPSTTAFVAPSATSFTDRNPEFRIYDVVADQVTIFFTKLSCSSKHDRTL